MIKIFIKFIKVNLIKELGKSSFRYTGAVKFITIFQYLFVIKIASANMSEENLGNFFLIYNSILFFSGLFFASQSSSLLRFYSIEDDRLALYKTTLSQVFLPISFVLILCGFLLILNIVPILALISILFGIGTGLILILYTQLRVSGRFRDYFLVAIIQAIFVVAVMLIYSAEINVTNIITILFLSQLCALVFILIKRYLSLRNIFLTNRNKYLSIDLLKYGMPFMLIAVSNTFISAYCQYILKYQNLDNDVGVYALNYSIGEKIIFIFFSIIVTYKVPEIYQESQRSIKNAIYLINGAVMMFLFYVLFIFIVSYFTSYYLSETFSTVYIAERGHWIILFSIISASFLGVFSLYNEILLSLKKSGVVALNYILLALIGALIGYFMILNYGILGAAIAPILANIIGLILLWMQIKRFV